MAFKDEEVKDNSVPSEPRANTANKANKANQASQASQPDKADATEYNFNMGLWRIETLNDILVGCAKKYRKAISKRDEKSVREYQALVNTLYTETYIYMEEETEIEEVDVEQNKKEVLENILDRRREYSSDEEIMEHLKEIRSVYLGVRQLMQQVNLDIPKKDKVGELDIFNQ